MNLDTIISRIPLWYIGRRSVYLKSGPGIGKTTTLVSSAGLLSQVFKKNFGYVIINGALLNPPDSVGYLIPKHLPDGRAESIYTDPFFWRTAEGKRLEEYDGGIIIVDEIDKADVDVKKIIGEACLSGRLGPHRLPPGWLVWAAGNRQKDRSGSTKELDHLINRRMEIDVEPDFNSWRNWADRNNVMPVTMAFAEQNPQIVFADTVPETQGPWCTPRSLVEFDGYIQKIMEFTLQSNIPDDPALAEEGTGHLGLAAASQYFTLIALEREMPSFDSIVRAPKTTPVPTKPDVQMLVCYSLAHRVNKDIAGPIIEYIERLPKDFAVTFAQSACKRKPILITTPAFRTWIKQNSSLLSVIALA